MINTCEIYFKNVFHDHEQKFQIIVGDQFKGVIRSIKILKWPKMDYHFTNKLKLTMTASYMMISLVVNQQCNQCQPIGLCLHCDDSSGPQYCTVCIEGSVHKPDVGCVLCHSSCKSCSGSTYSDCVSCNDGFQMQSGQCVEICGDGVSYYNQNQCDDGNQINNDGQRKWESLDKSKSQLKLEIGFNLDIKRQIIQKCPKIRLEFEVHK
ncbi:UNKNOWN [Stylonychia lemnae]|uniref:Insulin-like growth factor binding protein, N-terminal n=1 Tax=Stylonychia lemnae TaxID=5949 RepID=A0A078B681_STYLE|nr:UNKNOWN [Stylonychia lemnae]|eukprot:CDW89043.1 UNKNOWN [Stylonychia lemnae]